MCSAPRRVDSSGLMTTVMIFCPFRSSAWASGSFQVVTKDVPPAQAVEDEAIRDATTASGTKRTMKVSFQGDSAGGSGDILRRAQQKTLDSAASDCAASHRRHPCATATSHRTPRMAPLLE